MNISLQNAGKRYNRDWIFRHLDYTFIDAGRYAITGPNGSGKSTLLQVIAGAVLHNEGSIVYTGNKGAIEQSYRMISIAAPYLDLIEEMNPVEFLSFHATFKPLKKSEPEILESVGLEKAASKQIRYFSSGMKQRLKLAQAFFSNTPVLLLDEPTTNLDAEGIRLYTDLIRDHGANRTIIISSNVAHEYECCNEILSIEKYKSLPPAGYK